MTNTVTSDRLAEIAPEELSEQQAAVLETLVAGRGRVPTPFKVWLHSAELARHLQSLGNFLAKCTTLSRRELEIVVLTVAAHWKGDYVFAVHAREARAAGLTDEVIDAIGSNTPVNFTAARESTVYALCRSLMEDQPPTDAVFESAVRELGRAGVAEVLALFGYFTSVTLAMKLHRIAAP